MYYKTLCFLLIATSIFSKHLPSKPSSPSSDSQEVKKISFHTIIPPVASYLSLKLINKQANLAIPAEKIVATEVGAIALKQIGLSKSTAEKITHCSIAALNDRHPLFSPTRNIKTAGKALISEIIIDEIENSLPPFQNTKDNVFFQSAKLISKGLARDILDKKLDDMSDWYPTPLSYDLPPLNLDDDSDFGIEVTLEELEEHIKGLTTWWIQYSSKKFIAKQLIQTTGKHTYLSIGKIPIITADDVAAATVTGITSHSFENNQLETTVKEIEKGFIINKMTTAELSILKKCWHCGVNNSYTLAAINRWGNDHSTISSLPKETFVEFILTPCNRILFKQLLQKIKINQLLP